MFFFPPTRFALYWESALFSSAFYKKRVSFRSILGLSYVSLRFILPFWPHTDLAPTFACSETSVFACVTGKFKIKLKITMGCRQTSHLRANSITARTDLLVKLLRVSRSRWGLERSWTPRQIGTPHHSSPLREISTEAYNYGLKPSNFLPLFVFTFGILLQDL